MRRVFLFIFLFILFCFKNVWADELGQNVTFELLQTPYTTVTRRYQDDMVIFDLTNNIPTMNLSKTDLKNILSQKSGVGSSPLTIYETLNIIVTPIEGTNFDPLVGKTEYYRGSAAGSWVSNVNATVESSSVANKKSMTSSFWPYGYAVAYRTNTSEAWKNTVPSGVDLSNKTMEEKLATLIGVDLNANPDGVVNAYKDLFYFRILPQGYTYKTVFDFYSEKDGVLPVLVGGSTTDYLPSSLNLLDSREVVINYNKTEDAPTISVVNMEEQPQINVIGLILFVLLTIGTIVFYKKYGKCSCKRV